MYFTSNTYKRHIIYIVIYKHYIYYVILFKNCAIFTLWSPQFLHKHIDLWFSHAFYWHFMILNICNESQFGACGIFKVYNLPKHVIPIIKFRWRIANFFKTPNCCHHYFEKWIKSETFNKWDLKGSGNKYCYIWDPEWNRNSKCCIWD